MSDDKPLTTNLRDHDKTQVLRTLPATHLESAGQFFQAFAEPQQMPPLDDGSSLQFQPVFPEYTAEIHFRRVAGDADAYAVQVNGPAKFVSELLADACGRFLDCEER